MNYEIDYEGLREFLQNLTYQGVKNGDLTKAHTRNDIDFFYKTDQDKSRITLDSVIEYQQPFLVDAIGNDLSVCILTKRRYRLPTGRVAGMILDRTVIGDCRKVLGGCLNGSYVIPDRFILRT